MAATIIIIIRLVIFVTFLLLVVLCVVGIILARRFYTLYMREHLELQNKVEALERRIKLLEHP